MDYRLGIDLGSTSLGWCILKLHDNKPAGIENLGVRIFSDGRDAKSSEPLCVARRNSRSARRRRDRYIARRKNLMQCLIKNNLMPDNIAERKKMQDLNPLELRVKALDKKVSLHELGRAIFHLNQRRGFKSNRKVDRKNSDKGAVAGGINKLKEIMAENNSRTLGECYFRLNQVDDIHKHHLKKHIRIKPQSTKNNKNLYDYYPERSMYENEFDKIWEAQSKFHPELTSELKEQLKNIIFYQRDLKKQDVGRCSFEQDEERAPLAHPLSQKFRILQEINNLSLISEKGDPSALTQDQKNTLKNFLLEPTSKKNEIPFDKIRRDLKIDSVYKFNLESEKRKGLLCDLTARIMSSNDCFGKQWFSFSPEKQDEIISKCLTEENEQELIGWLCEKCRVNEETAKNISSADLPDGYGRLSIKAMQKIIPYLEQGYIYSDACRMAGYHHSDFRPDKLLDTLPYYGEALPNRVIGGTKNANDKPGPNSPLAQFEKYYGKINNPSVHIALNQLQKFVNELIKTYGHPKEIAIELARDLKLGRKKLQELEKQQTENKKTNERIDRELIGNGIKPNYEWRIKYKLWEELSKNPEQRCCPFTGKTIAVHDLLSDRTEIEHILPFSRTYDDTIANKTLSFTEANRIKGNKSPYEAFGHNPEGYKWEDILARSQNLPKNKSWRFLNNAMEKFSQQDTVIARQLTDTQYMSKIAKEYLQFICNPDKVQSIPGKLTALLRNKWGINLHNVLGDGDNEKDRTDHRHHAIDALVVALTTRETLRKVSEAAEEPIRHRLIERMPDPFDKFQSDGREKLKNLLENMVISHKPDHKGAKEAVKLHSTTGPLHAETAYGFVKELNKDTFVLSVRKKLADLDKKDIKNIADPLVRMELNELAGSCTDNEFKNRLCEYAQKNNITRIKILEEKSKDSVLGIKNKEGSFYKWYASANNYCAEIYCPKRKICDGNCRECKFKNKGVWECEIITAFDAHKKEFIPQWRKNHPYAKLMMRLFINDTVAYEENGKTEIRRVKKLSKTDRLIYLRDHRISEEKGDEKSRRLSAKQLHIKNARQIAVDILGRVKDPCRKPKCR